MAARFSHLTFTALCHTALAVAAMPLVLATSGERGVSVLMMAVAFVALLCLVSRRMVAFVGRGTNSAVFKMVAATASRLLVFATVVFCGFGSDELGLPADEMRLFGCLVVPFYLLQLVIDVRSAHQSASQITSAAASPC